ncbi:hypothetical protein NLI96_g12695 [Meripilus lineatus]|uniref:Uncharacterized protein n=1 Tax=Meripilus lineatus TaxID=2056292 RepID=A0AAD5YC55_9APHY|nr:hypothetical protein NLI96_g12695 [Physisporinus lineatus]
MPDARFYSQNPGLVGWIWELEMRGCKGYKVSVPLPLIGPSFCPPISEGSDLLLDPSSHFILTSALSALSPAVLHCLSFSIHPYPIVMLAAEFQRLPPSVL